MVMGLFANATRDELYNRSQVAAFDIATALLPPPPGLPESDRSAPPLRKVSAERYDGPLLRVTV